MTNLGIAILDEPVKNASQYTITINDDSTEHVTARSGHIVYEYARRYFEGNLVKIFNNAGTLIQAIDNREER